MFKLNLLLFFTLGSSFCFGQLKYEKETRLKNSQINQKASHFVKSLGFNTKIKWYKETGMYRSTIEAKTKYKGKKYSIEFTPDGVLEDVEIAIRWLEINEQVQKNVSSYLNLKYIRYKIEKIQIQYSGNPQEIRAFLQNKSFERTFNCYYEFVVIAKENKKYNKYELLFSESGNLIHSKKIIENATDHIDY